MPRATTEKGDDKVETTDLGDAAALKRKLDETAAKVIKESGYPEDHHIGNVKLALGAASVAIACTAQFYPVKHPDNKYVLMVCVALYMLLTTILNYYVQHFEGDIILQTHPPRSGQGSQGVQLTSKLPRHSYTYTLSIGPHIPGSKPVATLEKSLTQYYDVDGALVEDKFKAAVEDLLSRFEAKKAE